MNIKKLFGIYGVMLIVILIILGYTAVTYNTNITVSIKNDRVNAFNDDWQEENILENEKNMLYINTLPSEYISDMALVFKSFNCTVEAYIDSKKVYEFGIFENDRFIHSPGVTINIIDISEQDLGKDIIIKTTSPYNDGRLGKFLIGDKYSIIIGYIQENILSSSICFIMFLVGLICIITGIVIKWKFNSKGSLIYIGLFALTLALWSFTEIEILYLFVPNKIFFRNLAYLSLTVISIPLLMFIREVYGLDYKNLLDGAVIFDFITFLICVILQVLNIYDLRQTLVLTHISIALDLLIAIYVTFKGFFNAKIKKHSVEAFSVAMLVLAISIVIDIVKFYTVDYDDASRFLRIGFLICLIIFLVDTGKEFISIIQNLQESRTLKKMAYTDVLTGLGNRFAYQQEIEKLEDIDLLKRTIIAIMDLNDLKRVNDNLGHAMGDKYIIDSAKLIQEAFKDIGGVCYRIGGDEFAMIVKDVSLEAYFKSIKRMKKMQNEYNEKSEDLKIKISYGSAKFEEKIDNDVHDTIKRADDRMYRNKGDLKKISPNRPKKAAVLL